MFRFFGQPKFAGNGTMQSPIGYELFIREQVNGQWVLPDDFNGITALTVQKLLLPVIKAMPASVQLVSFNLEQNQFIDPTFLEMVTRVQDQTKINIFTELTERLAPGIRPESIIGAAARFHQRGLLVCVDDVGTGQNTPALVMRMNSSVTEYKFAFQDFQPYASIQEIEPKLDFWYKLAQRENKALAIEGIETAPELDEIQRKYPCDIVQGYLLGKPQPVRQSR